MLAFAIALACALFSFWCVHRGGYRWASQFLQTIEAGLHFPGHYLFFPGSLRIVDRVRGGRSTQRKSRYEKHAAYPRNACFDNATGFDSNDPSYNRTAAMRRPRRSHGYVPGIFSEAYTDLRRVLQRHAWHNASLDCLDRRWLTTHGASCRAHGAVDAPAAWKSGPYYHQPGVPFHLPCT